MAVKAVKCPSCKTKIEVDTFIRKVGFETIMERAAALYPEWDILVEPSDVRTVDLFRSRRGSAGAGLRARAARRRAVELR